MSYFTVHFGFFDPIKGLGRNLRFPLVIDFARSLFGFSCKILLVSFRMPGRCALNFENVHYRTAGAYIALDGLFPFVLGWKLHEGHLPVIRLGGEMEAGENGWQTTEREALEEAGIRLRPLAASRTYRAQAAGGALTLQEVEWEAGAPGEPRPLLQIAHRILGEPAESLMYLAETDQAPVPAAEVRGILLLERDDILRLCREEVTLGQYLDAGGRAILQAEFDRARILEPFIHLRLFARLLEAQLL